MRPESSDAVCRSASSVKNSRMRIEVSNPRIELRRLRRLVATYSTTTVHLYRRSSYRLCFQCMDV